MDTGKHNGSALPAALKHQSDDSYRLMVESVTKYAIFLLDATGRVTSWNPASERINGYSAEEVIGRHFSCFYAAEDAASGKPQLALEAARKQGSYEEEGPRMRKDGSLFHSIVNITALFDEVDGNTGFAIIARDIGERMLIEESLRESERRLVYALDATIEGVWDWNIKTGETYYSRWWIESLGYSPEEVPPHLSFWEDVVHPDDKPGLLMALQAHLEGRTPTYQYENRLRKKNGEYRWNLDRGKVVEWDADGKPVRMVGTDVDITERKQAEESARSSEARLRTVLEGMPVMLNAFDAHGTIILWNRECERVTGYRADEIEDNPRALELLYPENEYRAKMLAEWKRNGHDDNGGTWDITCKDGSSRTISWSNVSDRVPIPGWATWAIGMDVTGQNRAEDELRQSQRVLRVVMDNIPQAIFWKDRDSIYLGGNSVAAANMGFGDPFQIVGMSDLEMPFLAPEEAAFFISKDHEVMESNLPQYNIVEPFTRSDGKTIWLNTSKIPMHDDQGNVIGILGSYEDITERRKLEEQLCQSQKMEAIGQLAGGVAHDFNNLLTIILGYGELLVDMLAVDSPFQPPAREICHAADRAASLTRQLLAFSRKQILTPVVLDLNVVVANTEKMLQRLIGEDIILTTILDPSISQVKVDPGQIEQVILNLAVNARDAMPNGGKLIVESRNTKLTVEDCAGHPEWKPGRYVVLSMRDAGCGMTPEVMDHIFEPFYTTKAQGKGTGLGLATVYGIIRQSEGFLTVSSEVGVGTDFTVYLPIVESSPDVKTSEDLVTPLAGSETVLLVEDEEALRRFIRRSLEKLGYNVLVAANGREGMSIADAHVDEIDIVVTDVVMPELSGRQLAEYLRARDQNLKVLFMSGYTNDAVLRNGISAEQDSFLQKPFSGKDLAKRLREMLDVKD